MHGWVVGQAAGGWWRGLCPLFRGLSLDPQLNIYDPNNPNQPAYDEAYVTHYRAAQMARNRRITAWVKETLADLRQNGRENHERAFCVQGTMADLRWTDPTQDPSDRTPHSCYLGEPVVANDGPVGLARFTTLRSWLSQCRCCRRFRVVQLHAHL